MTKELRKKIMKRSKLKNKYNKKRNYENWSLYKKTKKYCLSLLRKTKKVYFEKLNIKEIGDNKTLWKTFRSYFSDKDNKSSKITLVEKGCHSGWKKSLNLKARIINTTDDIQSLIKRYDNHSSIRKIKEAYPEIAP